MNPLIGAGLITAGSSLLGGALQFGQADKANKWQEEMIDKQNQWNLAQWKRENAYNDPSAQMARLKKAGLNPDLVFGNGQIQNVGAHSPFQSNIGSPHEVDLRSYVHDFSQSLNTALDADIKKAQKNLLDEQRETEDKKQDRYDQETKILSSDAKFRDAINQGNLDFTHQNIDLAKTNIDWKKEDISRIRNVVAQGEKTLKQLDLNLQQTREAIAGMQFDNKVKAVKAAFAQWRESSECRQLMASADLTEKQASKYFEVVSSQLFGMEKAALKDIAQTELTYAEESKVYRLISNLAAEGDNLRLKYELDSRYGDVERITGILSAVPSAIAKIVGGYTIK